MGRGEFEEILEECLSALLEGRRSIEESLSLYPAWRGHLEPLLRAAEEIAAGLDHIPPAYVKERGLHRFLESARARRRLRQLLAPQARGVPRWRWAPVGLATVIVLGALSLMSATIMAEDGQRLSGGVGASVSVKPYSGTFEGATPAASVQTPLERVQGGVAVLEDAVRQGESVEVVVLEALEEASAELAAELDKPEEVGLMQQVAAVSAASRQYELLRELQTQSTGVRARAIEAGLVAVEEVLHKLGVTPTPPPEATPSPEPAPSASPTASPSPEPPVMPDEGSPSTPPPTSTPAQ